MTAPRRGVDPGVVEAVSGWLRRRHWFIGPSLGPSLLGAGPPLRTRLMITTSIVRRSSVAARFMIETRC